MYICFLFFIHGRYLFSSGSVRSLFVFIDLACSLFLDLFISSTSYLFIYPFIFFCISLFRSLFSYVFISVFMYFSLC